MANVSVIEPLKKEFERATKEVKTPAELYEGSSAWIQVRESIGHS